MDSSASLYHIHHTTRYNNVQSATDTAFESVFEYIDRNTKKSLATKAFYAKKYIHRNDSIKKDFPDAVFVEDSNYSQINTLFPELFITPFPEPTNPSFTFVDLFSGIGGFHQAMLQLNGKCVLSSEIDNFAVDTYLDNYGVNSNRDIRNIKDAEIPKHTVLCAGFPCQSFSKAGKQMGFSDLTKGTLFFEIVRILQNKNCNPDYIILENVRNLLGHDNGNTWKKLNN